MFAVGSENECELILCYGEAQSIESFEKVSTHNLRRGYARLLVDEQMNPRVVMAVGGWDSFAAIEPYLNAPSEDVIDQTFAEAEF